MGETGSHLKSFVVKYFIVPLEKSYRLKLNINVFEEQGVTEV